MDSCTCTMGSLGVHSDFKTKTHCTSMVHNSMLQTTNTCYLVYITTTWHNINNMIPSNSPLNNYKTSFWTIITKPAIYTNLSAHLLSVNYNSILGNKNTVQSIIRPSLWAPGIAHQYENNHIGGMLISIIICIIPKCW